MKLRIHRLAVAEIDGQVAYYEGRCVGLGGELDEAILRLFSLIQQFPSLGAPSRERADRRTVVLDRFPFTIPYQVGRDEIVILALAHTSRRPGYWSRRT